MKCFISLGNGNSINIDVVDKEKSYLDTKTNKFVLFDKYGTRFFVEPKLTKNKL